jgi:hypothetical protein
MRERALEYQKLVVNRLFRLNGSLMCVCALFTAGTRASAGQESTIYNFPEDTTHAMPASGLVMNAEGNLFGTTVGGPEAGTARHQRQRTPHGYCSTKTLEVLESPVTASPTRSVAVPASEAGVNVTVPSSPETAVAVCVASNPASEFSKQFPARP